MVIKIPVFQTFKQVNRHMKSSFKPSLDGSTFSSGCNISYHCFLTNAMTQCTMLWGVFCSTYRVCHKYFNLKQFISYYFKECTYLLIKTFIHIFSLIFFKICGRSAALMDDSPLLFNSTTPSHVPSKCLLLQAFSR